MGIQWIKADGTIIECLGVKPTLEWLQEKVGGWIECAYIDDNTLVVNEEGKLKDLPLNRVASGIWQAHFGDGDVIVGDAVYITKPDSLE